MKWTKWFNHNSDFLTNIDIAVFNPIANNFLDDNLILKCTNYYEDDEYFTNKVIIQSRLAKNMFKCCTNIIDFYKEICNMGKSFAEIKIVLERVGISYSCKFSIS